MINKKLFCLHLHSSIGLFAIFSKETHLENSGGLLHVYGRHLQDVAHLQVRMVYDEHVSKSYIVLNSDLHDVEHMREKLVGVEVFDATSDLHYVHPV